VIYLVLIFLLLMQRLYEMRLGKRHLSELSDQLLSPIDEREKKQMLWLHTSWFIALVLEYLWHGQLVDSYLFGLGALILIACQAVRFHTMQVLGVFWVPYPVSFQGQQRLTKGLYRFFRHPNYAVVVIELFLIPWMGGCFWVMGIWGILNVFFLYRRIRIEENALRLLEAL
jgi:methyltransferase